MAVLKMLEQGTINAEEAERLLKVLQGNGKKKSEKSADDFDLNDTIDRMGKKVGHFARKVGATLEDVSTDMEPKIRKAAKTVTDKTQDFAQDIKTAYEERKAERDAAKQWENPPKYDEEVTEDDIDMDAEGSIIDMTKVEESASPAEEAAPAEETGEETPGL